MKLFSIPTGNLKLDGGAMFGVVPKVLWSKLYPADSNNLCNWIMRCLLIDDGERRILIDNGIGDKQEQKFLDNYHLNGDDSLEKSLAKYGYSTDSITDVILTHLHFDHCGGSVKHNADKSGFELTFCNATYHTSRRQWLWATKPNRREKASFLSDNILPIEQSGHLQLFDEDCKLFPNIFVRQFDGHTDGQVIPIIRTPNHTVVYMADVLPSTAHIPIPFIMSYDTRPLLSMDEKERFLEEAVENNYILFFEHDLYHECCTLQRTPKGIREKESFTLESIFNHSTADCGA